MVTLVDFLDDYESAGRFVDCLDCFSAKVLDDFILLLLASMSLRLHNLVHANF